MTARIFFLENESSSDISDDDQSSGENDRSSTSDNKDRVRNSDGGANDNNVRRRNQEVPLIAQALQWKHRRQL